nr:uncharacterized protein LOC118970785 isoform X2 [Manis javanica]
MVSVTHWPASRQPPSAKDDWEVRPLTGTEQETSQGRGMETPALRTRKLASQPVYNWQVCSLPDTTGQTRAGALPRRSSSHPWNTSLAEPSASFLGATCPGLCGSSCMKVKPWERCPSSRSAVTPHPCTMALRQPERHMALLRGVQGLSEGTRGTEMVSKHPEDQSSRCATAVSVASFGPCWASLSLCTHAHNKRKCQLSQSSCKKVPFLPSRAHTPFRPVCPGALRTEQNQARLSTGESWCLRGTRLPVQLCGVGFSVRTPPHGAG